MELISQYKSVYYIRLTEEEVDELYKYLNLDDLGIEVFEGDNCLEKNTLEVFIERLEMLNYHNHTTFNLLNGLSELCGYTEEY